MTQYEVVRNADINGLPNKKLTGEHVLPESTNCHGCIFRIDPNCVVHTTESRNRMGKILQHVGSVGKVVEALASQGDLAIVQCGNDVKVYCPQNYITGILRVSTADVKVSHTFGFSTPRWTPPSIHRK